MGACEVAGCKKERCRWIFISEKGRYVRKFCWTEGHFPPGALTNQEANDANAAIKASKQGGSGEAASSSQPAPKAAAAKRAKKAATKKKAAQAAAAKEKPAAKKRSHKSDACALSTVPDGCPPSPPCSPLFEYNVGPFWWRPQPPPPLPSLYRYDKCFIDYTP